MVDANIKRTVGDIGEYALYDLGHVTGGVATYAGAGQIAGAQLGEQSRDAAIVSGVSAFLMFLFASIVDSERVGDFLATASIGAVGSAIGWGYGLNRAARETANLCPCNESRRREETDEWAETVEASETQQRGAQRRQETGGTSTTSNDTWG